MKTHNLLNCLGYCRSIRIKLGELRADGPRGMCPRAASHREGGCSSPNNYLLVQNPCDQLGSGMNDQHTQPAVRDQKVSYPGLSDVWGHDSHKGYLRCPVGNLPGSNHLQVDSWAP